MLDKLANRLWIKSATSWSNVAIQLFKYQTSIFELRVSSINYQLLKCSNNNSIFKKSGVLWIIINKKFCSVYDTVYFAVSIQKTLKELKSKLAHSMNINKYHTICHSPQNNFLHLLLVESYRYTDHHLIQSSVYLLWEHVMYRISMLGSVVWLPCFDVTHRAL